MDDLRDLYQEVILDHGRKPRNFRKIENANRIAEGKNPLCGDHIIVYLLINGETIEDISFDGAGCAICTASASMMTQGLKGKSLAEAETIFGGFHDMVTDVSSSADADVGKLKVFAGVREYPMRIKCATLPWHTFQAAKDNRENTISTE
jgi:nitrogen fixation protein NifU and related proteins